MRLKSEVEYLGSMGSSTVDPCMIFRTRAGRFYVRRIMKSDNDEIDSVSSDKGQNK